jgi:hypothetical protein
MINVLRLFEEVKIRNKERREMYLICKYLLENAKKNKESIDSVLNKLKEVYYG